MLREDYLKQLMCAIYDKKTLNLFDFSAENLSPDAEEFKQYIEWGNDLAQEKLAVFTDKDLPYPYLTSI